MEGDSNSKQFSFIDVFAGCGGLSLGLLQAGFKGIIAIEKDPSAFETFSTNLLSGDGPLTFQWPAWLPKDSIGISELIEEYKSQLTTLNGQVDVLVGGPPCQGYSCAGRRDPNDPRNALFNKYLELVGLIQPSVVFIENVRGMTLDFKPSESESSPVNYAKKLINELSKDYHVYSRMMNLSRFGVPQNRVRFLIIAIKKDHPTNISLPANPFDLLESTLDGFVSSKGLITPLPSKAALSDLEVTRNGTAPSHETEGFNAINYLAPITPYQKLMRSGSSAPPSDTRLPNHREEIVKRFANLIRDCHAEGRLNTSISKDSRAALGLRKNAIRVLDPDRPSPTVTSMPDDLIHYSEPRTLTVRENARLQSFPDWFKFMGQYTTGGKRRRHQVPRYTQVANAVPPLAAEAIGFVLSQYLRIQPESPTALHPTVAPATRSCLDALEVIS